MGQLNNGKAERSGAKSPKRRTQNCSGMTLEVVRQGNVVVVSPHGRLAEPEARPLERELLNYAEQKNMKIVCDLSDVPFVTSACLGALMVAHRRSRETGGYVRIVQPQPLVRQILEITKLTKLFGLYASVQDAIKAP